MKPYDKLPRPFFALAPLDDVTDTVFRQIIAGCAPADLYFTEFVNVDGLQSPGREKLLPKLRFGPAEHPLIAQLWGKNPENFYKTTKELIAMGFDGVDINFGCPDKTIMRQGACAALINNRGLTGEIIAAVRAGAGRHFPVSLKTRLGIKNIDFGWHEFLLSHNLNALTIHGRTVSEMSKVPAHWDAIGTVRQMRDRLCPSTLIIGNGDVFSRASGLRLAQKYGLEGVMIGRGALADPFVFSADSPWPKLGKDQRLGLYKKHVELFADTWQRDERRVVTLNKFCKLYVSGFDGAKELREQLMQAASTDELLNLLAAA